MADKNIGIRIKIARKSRKMTQETLASLAGDTHKSAINKVELGKSGISDDKLQAVADALHVSIEYLKSGVTPSETTSPMVRELVSFISELSKESVKTLLDMAQFLYVRENRGYRSTSVNSKDDDVADSGGC